MSNITTLLVENNVYPHHINIIIEYFEKYHLAKIDSIKYCDNNMCLIIKLEYWYDNTCASNFYERICLNGQANIVYNDPAYFTVKFNEEVEEDTVDSRDEYITRENLIMDSDYDNNSNEEEHAHEDIEEHAHEDIEEPVSECQSHSSQAYLEDDVIENTNNIDNLFAVVNELKETIIHQEKIIKSFSRRLFNINKKTNILYKCRPIIIKRSVWDGRLRNR